MAALTITKRVLENGNRNYRATYSFAGDGTSTISAYVAADGSSGGDMGVIIQGATYYPLLHLKLWRVRYNLSAGLSIEVQWDATSAENAWIAYGFGEQCWMKDGGLFIPNSPALVGATGKILFTAIPSAPASNSTGSLELWLKKDFAQ